MGLGPTAALGGGVRRGGPGRSLNGLERHRRIHLVIPEKCGGDIPAAFFYQPVPTPSQRQPSSVLYMKPQWLYSRAPSGAPSPS